MKKDMNMMVVELESLDRECLFVGTSDECSVFAEQYEKETGVQVGIFPTHIENWM